MRTPMMHASRRCWTAHLLGCCRSRPRHARDTMLRTRPHVRFGRRRAARCARLHPLFEPLQSPRAYTRQGRIRLKLAVSSRLPPPTAYE